MENWHNIVMSSVRVSVEWMFAKIKETSFIVSDAKTMKVGYDYIAHHVTSAYYYPMLTVVLEESDLFYI